LKNLKIIKKKVNIEESKNNITSREELELSGI
jgi:hypothetical protein